MHYVPIDSQTTTTTTYGDNTQMGGSRDIYHGSVNHHTTHGRLVIVVVEENWRANPTILKII